MDEILKLAQGIGDLTVLVTISAVVIYFLVKYLSIVMEWRKQKLLMDVSEHANNTHEASAFDSVKPLKDSHPYFTKTTAIVDIKLPITVIGGPVRTEIFRDVLKIFYATQLEKMGELLEKNITKENFLNENTKTINNIIKAANEKMEENEIPEVVRRKFWEWNNERHEYVLSTLSDIDSSTVFGSIVEKEYAVLNLLQANASFCLMDAEKTLKNLNGDLTGIIYKGKEVEPLHG